MQRQSDNIFNPLAAICRWRNMLPRVSSILIANSAYLSDSRWSSADRSSAVPTWRSGSVKKLALPHQKRNKNAGPERACQDLKRFSPHISSPVNGLLQL